MSHLLVLRLSALGDVIHTIPAVRALGTIMPEARISWLVEAPYRELVEIVAGVEAIPVRIRKWGKAPIASRTEIREALRAMRTADATIDFQGLLKSAVLGWLSGAKNRAGFFSGAIRETPALLFSNRKVVVDTAKHVVDQNLQLALSAATESETIVNSPLRTPSAPAMVPPPSADRRLSTRTRWAEYAKAAGLEPFAGSVVLLPGAGKRNKLWPVERFRELAKQIGPKALAVWGPGEQELAIGTGARVAPPTNLRELAWLLQKAEVVIGADTGPLHLADALGTKVVGLFGPTDPRRNGPYHQVQRCIDRFQTTKSMDSISVEEVMTMLARVRGE